MNQINLLLVSALALLGFLSIPINEVKHPFKELDGSNQAIVETRRIGFCDVKSSSEPWYITRGVGFTCDAAVKNGIKNIKTP